ncbi:MAG TPA: hypothetical protein VGI45_10190 [Terracidiphilus sp.]
MKVFSFCLQQQRRHLRQPRRRLLPQKCHDRSAVSRAAKARKTIEHREIGFPGTIVFQTLTLCYKYSRRLGSFLQESSNDSSFPDTGLPGNENGLAFAGKSRLQTAPQPCKFHFATQNLDCGA